MLLLVAHKTALKIYAPQLVCYYHTIRFLTRNTSFLRKLDKTHVSPNLHQQFYKFKLLSIIFSKSIGLPLGREN